MKKMILAVAVLGLTQSIIPMEGPTGALLYTWTDHAVDNGTDATKALLAEKTSEEVQAILRDEEQTLGWSDPADNDDRVTALGWFMTAVSWVPFSGAKWNDASPRLHQWHEEDKARYGARQQALRDLEVAFPAQQ